MLINKIRPQILFEADSGGGNGGELPDSVAKAFEKLVERKGGDASAVAMMLFTENKQYRDTINDLRGKVPPEGAVILNADEAKDWQAYRELGAVTDVKQGLEQRTQLQGQLDEAKRGETLRTVAEAAGYKPSVLAQLDRIAKAEGKALAFDVREQTVDGKQVQVPFVKDGDKESALAEYAATQWADFLPALTVQAQQQQQTGTRFPPQHPGGNGGGKPKDLVDKFVAEQNEKASAVKNPLLKD